MHVVRCCCLLIGFLSIGCVCIFEPCNRRIHLSGHVLDAEREPVPYAIVELNGMKRETDETGCFYFGEGVAASEFDLTVTKLGYKPYRTYKEIDFYEVITTLMPENSEQQSSALWHKLYVEEISKFKDCSER
jgi:hypothetical protein